MKVIDLLKKIENGENIPKKIKVYQEVFEWDTLDYYYRRSNGDDLLELCTIFNTGELLSMEVELIEDEPIEDEIDIDSIKKLEGIVEYSTERNTINQLIQAVKQLKKEVKELKEEIYNENDNL